jgi:hypothetical protein
VRRRDLAYETVVLTAVLFGVWVATLASIGVAEVVVGSGAALICVLAAVTARRVIGQLHSGHVGDYVAWLFAGARRDGRSAVDVRHPAGHDAVAGSSSSRRPHRPRR